MLETTNCTSTERPTTGHGVPQDGDGKGRRPIRAAVLMVTLAVIAAVGFAIVSRSAPGPTTDTDVTSGFEYTTDATSGRMASTPVTGQYFGNSDEMFPERDLTSGFEYNTDATSGKVATDRVTSVYFGYNPDLNPEH